MIIIKKEKDRKYYDSSKKKYVTLSDLANYLTAGKTIKVIDYQGKDISSQTIVRILAKTSNPKLINDMVTKSSSNFSNKMELSKEARSIIINEGLEKTREVYKTSPSSAPFIMQMFIDLAYKFN